MKKIFYSLLLCISLFLFSDNVEALQCLYESKDGSGQVILNQSSINSFGSPDYYAHVKIIEPFKYNGKTYDNSTYVAEGKNNANLFNPWKKINECSKYLIYVPGLTDTAYVCDSKSSSPCKNKKGETFKLVDPYEGKTENNVSLNKLRCTYEYVTEMEYTETFAFEITLKNIYDPSEGGSYSLWHNHDHLYDNDFDKSGINTTEGGVGYYQSSAYYDYFSIRNFWNPEKKSYECPKMIKVQEFTKQLVVGSAIFNSQYYINYDSHTGEGVPFTLAYTASYIDYDTSLLDLTIGNYTYEDKVCDGAEDDYTPGCTPETYFTLLQQENKATKKIEMIFSANRSYFTIPSNITMDFSKEPTGDLNDFPIIYTDCINNKSGTCVVTDKQVSGYTKLVLDGWTNTQDTTDVEIGMGYYNGFDYKKMMCKFADVFGQLGINKEVLKATVDLEFHAVNPKDDVIYNITEINSDVCENWGIATGFTCDDEYCKTNLMTIFEDKLYDVKSYCNEIYLLHASNVDQYVDRKDECRVFNRFYNDLVSKGIIVAQDEGCSFISPELEEKLIFVLDLLKIAGPILALGLGTLDFVKVLASGDADKEMKTAFKKFSIRIVAAILLFIIPVILAFLLDTFIGNQDGYDSDNPFCNVVDWEE